MPTSSKRLLVVAIPVTVLALALGAAAVSRLLTGAGTGATSPAASAYEQRDWKKAAEHARARLKQAGDDLEALRILARASARLGRDDTATVLYNERIRRERMEPEDLHMLGTILRRQGNEDLALGVWSKVAEEHPDRPELLSDLAALAVRRQNLEVAREAAETLARLPGWEARGLLLLGESRTLLEDPKGAVEALSGGLALDPTAREAALPPATYRKLLAGGLLRLGRPEEALRTLVADEADEEACWLSGRAALQLGRLDLYRSLRAKSGPYRSRNPSTPEPSPFIGQARCVQCHPDEGRAHAASRHNRSFHRGEALLSLPRPDGPLPDPDRPDVTHRFEQVGGRLKVVTSAEGRIAEVLIDYAFGTTGRYVTMVGRDGEGRFRALRSSWYRTEEGTGWGRTSGDVGSTEEGQDSQGQLIDVRDGVVRCLGCHSTNPRAFRDPEMPEGGPELADPSIGCERCHGPGLHHALAVEHDLPDRAIVNASTPAANFAQCRACHIVGNPAEIARDPGDPQWVRSPGVTLASSRCYTESGGRLGCLNCHDAHHDGRKSADHYDRKCLGCHAGGPDASGLDASREADATVEAPACTVNPSRNCTGCHMPKVAVPVLHTKLTDHFIRKGREAGSSRP